MGGGRAVSWVAVGHGDGGPSMTAHATRFAADAEGECSAAGYHGSWTQEEIVMLHGILFDTCVDKLTDPKTPLDEVIDCLRWIFSDAGKEARPFSFSNTLRLYQRPQAHALREAIQRGLKSFLSRRLRRYPPWVAAAFWSDPDRFADDLESDPQWGNRALAAPCARAAAPRRSPRSSYATDAS